MKDDAESEEYFSELDDQCTWTDPWFNQCRLPYGHEGIHNFECVNKQQSLFVEV